jgi:hypothetical protein
MGRKPISVAALLEREGYRPRTRSRATKRALSGVAAGAVLALGAVVGSLLLNHGASSTAGDTLASGSQSGGDIVLAESGTPYGTAQTSTTHAGTSATTPRTTPSASSGAPRVSQNGTHGATHGHTDDSVATGRGYTGYSGANRSTTSSPVTTTTGRTTTDAPTTTGAAPTTTAPTTTPPATTTDTTPSGSTSSTAPSTTSDTTTPPATTSSSGGGVLGTVTGTLDDVTAPVFNWFG